jgi:homoserine kinase, Neisseria type
MEDVNSFEGIRNGVSNSNYLLFGKNNKYILTIFEEMTNDRDLPYFFQLMNHLNSKNIMCPRIIKDKTNNFSNIIKGKQAAISSFLEGQSIEHIKPSHCAELGTMVAKFHNASNELEIYRENDLGINKLEAIIGSIDKISERLSPSVIDVIHSENDYLKNISFDIPSGIIHADLFPDNIFFNENKLSGIIDFYFACNDFYAYEIATCLNAWCFEKNNEFNISKAKALLSNYNLHKKFSSEELECLPLLARASALRYLLTRLIDFYTREDSELIIKKDPDEYL